MFLKTTVFENKKTQLQIQNRNPCKTKGSSQSPNSQKPLLNINPQLTIPPMSFEKKQKGEKNECGLRKSLN